MAARSPALAFLVLLPAAALAGCFAQPTAVDPAGLGPRAPALEAPGAEVEALADAARATWHGTVEASKGALLVDARWPLPVAQGLYAELPFRWPPEATLLEGELAWEGAPGFLGFVLANATGSVWCGALPGARDSASCLAPVPTPRNAAEEWAVRVLGDATAAAPQPVPYTFTLTARAVGLPRYGPPAPFGDAAPLRFAPPVVVDAERYGVEPSIALTPSGDVYVAALVGQPGGLYRARSGGAFERVDPGPLATCTGAGVVRLPALPLPTAPRAGFTHVGCGDVDVAAAGDRDVYFTYHWGDEGVASTHDGGATWTTQPLGTGPELHTDRQWLATNGPMEAWMAYDGMTTYAGLGSYVSRTLDGGLTWTNLGKVLGNTRCVTGLARAPAPATTLYVVGCDERGPGVAVSHDGGITFDWHTIVAREVPDFFVKVATDAGGSVYAAWTEPAPQGLAVMVSRSLDEGATWSEPRAVTPPLGTYVYPWLTGGAAGHVAVAFYGTLATSGAQGATAGDNLNQNAASSSPERIVGDWYPVVALSEDGGDRWQLASVTDEPIQYGPICLGGNGCVHGRNLGDFFQLQADKDGMLHIAYVDSGLVPDRAFARLAYARQAAGLDLGGPSVEKDGGASRQ
jgi:hypothetical protein